VRLISESQPCLGKSKTLPKIIKDLEFELFIHRPNFMLLIHELLKLDESYIFYKMIHCLSSLKKNKTTSHRKTKQNKFNVPKNQKKILQTNLQHSCQ